MRDRIGRKLILIGAVGLIIGVFFDVIVLIFSYTIESIEDIIRYRWYTSLSDIVFKSRLFGIISAYLIRLYLMFFSIFLIVTRKKSDFILKINGLFFIGFYIEHLPSITLNVVLQIENAVSGVLIIIGIILLDTEWFTEGHRIENYGKAVLTASSWIMLILSGSYLRRITTSIAIDYSINGMKKLSDIVFYNVDIIWVIKFNIFMLSMCLFLLFLGNWVLKRLREDDTENMLLRIVIIGILIIYTGVYRGMRSYPVGIIRPVWQLHWFTGAFLITGGILNHIGIKLRSRKEIVDLQER